MDRKRVGFLGGSFDPIHLGHLSLAIQIQEKFSLDEMWMVPAFCSPAKWETPPTASAEHRCLMVREAIHWIPHFFCIDWEAKRKKPSYTVDALRHFKKEQKDLHLYLILSNESVESFPSWKESKKILELAEPIIGIREPHFMIPEELKPYQVVQTKIMDISSTEIRERLKKKQYVQHLLPFSVYQYIHQHQLYR